MLKIQPIIDFVLTDHALIVMTRRDIHREEVQTVLAKPEQVEMVRKSRAVYQAKYDKGEPPKTYILRVFVDVDREPPHAVTVYRTSKIEKYWR